MYLAGLSGCDEVNALLKKGGPFTQSYIQAIWDAASFDPPAPLLPASMEGKYVAHPPRGKPIIADTMNVGDAIKGIKRGTAHPANAQEMDFINFFMHVTADPCRKLTPVQKVADAIIKVATVAVPVASYFQAATQAINAGAAVSNRGADAALTARVMQPAVDQLNAQALTQAKADEDAKAAAFESQLKALQAATSAPTSPTLSLVPSSSSVAQIPLPTGKAQASRSVGLTDNELLVAALALLGVAVIYRSAA